MASSCEKATQARTLMLFFFSLALTVWPTVYAFVSFVPGTRRSSSSHHYAFDLQTITRRRTRLLLQSTANVVTTTNESGGEDDDDNAAKSLLDVSLDLDPRWREARIPFVERHSNRVIDCHLAFCVDLDNPESSSSSSSNTRITYGIGVPCDVAVAITLEEEEEYKGQPQPQQSKITYLNPTDTANEEIVQFFAEQLQEYLGPDVYLKNTPKILTISGNLQNYTANWKETLFDDNDTLDRETLMDDSDEGLDYFLDFMKRELGEEEVQNTLNECRNDGGGTVDKDIWKLFTVPGLGQQVSSDTVESMIEEMNKSYANDMDDDVEFVLSPFTKIGTDLTHDGVALKLVGFHLDKKSYALVQLLKPFTIVGRYIPQKENLCFELLTPEEEALILPRLERICQKDLEEAGLLLS